MAFFDDKIDCGAPSIRDFQKLILDFFDQRGRTFPWRETHDPYEVLVSELMLQQTQTDRVAAKYGPFLRRFPDFPTLASAGLEEVFVLWRGLGYNRRAKALRDIASRVVDEFGGRLPADPELLESFPGIGPYTARAICAFAFDLPVVFVETNIRRVFLHFFFPGREKVRDRELLPLLEKSLYRQDPRSWYYALMDYGAQLRGQVPNPNTRSAHYARQSPFENSNRQIRGRILSLLSSSGRMSAATIQGRLPFPEERVRYSLNQLVNEGLLVCEENLYQFGG